MKEKLPFIIYIGIGAVLMAASLRTWTAITATLVFWVGFARSAPRACSCSNTAGGGPPHTKTLRSQTAGGPHQRRGRAQANAADAGGLPGQPAHVLDPAGADFMLALLKAPAWIILILFVLWIFQYIVGVVIYHRLEKRM